MDYPTGPTTLANAASRDNEPAITQLVSRAEALLRMTNHNLTFSLARLVGHGPTADQIDNGAKLEGSKPLLNRLEILCKGLEEVTDQVKQLQSLV